MPSPSLSHPARRVSQGLPARSAALLAALVAVLLVALSPGSAAAAVSPAAEPDPLLVHLESMTPVLAGDAPVTISGTVTNRSTEEWTGVNLHAFRSTAPITDATSLAASAAIDPIQYVGDRVTDPDTFATVPVLEPGETADFTLTVPREVLGIPDLPGVYWIGVHALGDSSVPRDELADGRARTFIPVVPAGRERVDTAIVMPLRATVWHHPDGRVARTRHWAQTLGEGGRLDALLDAGEAAGDAPITWLVDPAVPAAIARLSVGNPARSLAPDPAVPQDTVPEQPDPAGSASSGAAPFTAAAPVPTADPETELSDDEQELAELALAWLERFKLALSNKSVLALPYGDLDASAAASHDPGYYQQAVDRSAAVMTYFGIPSVAALAPRDGVVSPAALAAATPESTVLLGDTAFAVPPTAPDSMVQLLGHKVVVTSQGASSGGPAPTPPDDSLAIRQRVLSEAALRLLGGSPAPMVVMLPADWHPSDPGVLFEALLQNWVAPVDLADVHARPAVPLDSQDLVYTDADRAAELDQDSFEAADDLQDSGDLMARVLTRETLVRPQVADEALATLSLGHRGSAPRSAASAQAAAAYLDQQLGAIRVEAPGKVVLSSASGTLGTDVINGLDQPVTVRIESSSDADLDVEDAGLVHLAANSRSRLLLDVKAHRLGVHQVELLVADADGTPLGSSTELPIRAAQVSEVIWYILALGAALLFGAIGVRLVRRIRAAAVGVPSPDSHHPRQDTV